jgi:hypothetical protein
MGNAQTHCVQLANTFAFARGAAGKPVREADYVAFAEDLIPGLGETIVRAWKALAGSDPAVMRACAAELAEIPARQLKTLGGIRDRSRGVAAAAWLREHVVVAAPGRGASEGRRT